MNVGRLGAAASLLCAGTSTRAVPPPLPEVPRDYFAEPTNLPFDLQILEKKPKAGWHWTELTYTSVLYDGEPVRVHALYALPDAAGPAQRVPAIVCTHGSEHGPRGFAEGTSYWLVIEKFAQAGYAVLFYDWQPDPLPEWDPAKPGQVRRFTDYGQLDFRKTGRWGSPAKDFKDGIHYQAMMAAKRGLSWLIAQPEVDGNRVGAFGSSYGGIFSSMFFAIEPRLSAVNPEVYTAEFGVQEESYNRLPDGWPEAAIQAWRARFDSYVTLAKRSGPILYTVGSNDPTFLLTKAARMFAAMPAPKHLLIGPNEGHGYWALDQSVLFFDETLKGGTARPVIRDTRATIDGRQLGLSTRVERCDASRGRVEFFVAPVFETDPDRGPDAVRPFTWVWTGVEAARQADGSYAARYPLPVMRPRDPQERIYYWGDAPVLDPHDPKVFTPPVVAPEKLRGALRVFARATAANGALACSPLLDQVPFSDPPAEPAAATSQEPQEGGTGILPVSGHRGGTGWKPVSPSGVPDPLRAKNGVVASPEPATPGRPVFEGAVRLRTPTAVVINSAAPVGQPMATFDLPLPTKAVGTCGYALWNWCHSPPDATLKTDGTLTPTKRILPPFADTVKPNSFQPRYWSDKAVGGFISFTINGTPDQLDRAKCSGHGGLYETGTGGGMEELPLAVSDDREHRVTLVMPACQTGECNLRVTLATPAGSETVCYRHTAGGDQVFQFRFQGQAVLRVRQTSPPARPDQTIVGPSAIFLD